MEHTHSIPVLTIVYDICYNDLCKPIEKYICVSEKHPFTGCLAAKRPKHNKLRVTNERKKTVKGFMALTLAPVITLLI